MKQNTAEPESGSAFLFAPSVAPNCPFVADGASLFADAFKSMCISQPFNYYGSVTR